MSKKKRCQKQLRVQMKYAPTSDANERLSHAIDVLLRSAARNATTLGDDVNAEKGEPRQAPEKDALSGGEGSEPCE